MNFILNEPYMLASVILIVSILLAKIVLFIFKHYVERLIKKKSPSIGNKFVITLEHPIVILIVLVGAEFALNQLSLANLTYENLIKTIIVVVITYLFIEISYLVLKYWQNERHADNVAFHEEVMPLIKSLVKLTLIITSIVIILQLWGVAVGTLITSLGIIGIILGFAFKDSMSNIFGGISLILDDSLHKHDVIELSTGEKGEVIEVNLRSTKIKTYNNNYLIIPNGLLSVSKFYNYAEPTTVYRLCIDFSVSYGSDIDFVKEVALETLKGRDDVLKFPKRFVRFIKMSDFSLDFQLFFYISDYKNMFEMADSVTSELYKNLVKNNITIPFPTRIVYNRNDDKKSKKSRKNISVKKVKLDDNKVNQKNVKKKSKK